MVAVYYFGPDLNDLKVIDVSGGEVASLMVHSLEVGNLQVREEFLAVDASAMIYMLVNGMQEQQSMIEQLLLTMQRMSAENGELILTMQGMSAENGEMILTMQGMSAENGELRTEIQGLHKSLREVDQLKAELAEMKAILKGLIVDD